MWQRCEIQIKEIQGPSILGLDLGNCSAMFSPVLDHLGTCTLCRKNALAHNALLTKRTLFLSFRDDDAAFHKDLLLPEKDSAKHDILS